jgi:hypothetical protein
MLEPPGQPRLVHPASDPRRIHSLDPAPLGTPDRPDLADGVGATTTGAGGTTLFATPSPT